MQYQWVKVIPAWVLSSLELTGGHGRPLYGLVLQKPKIVPLSGLKVSSRHHLGVGVDDVNITVKYS